MPHGVGLKDERSTSNRLNIEHRTSNIERPTSNNDVAALRNLISFVLLFPIFFSPSTPLRAVSPSTLLRTVSLSDSRFDTHNEN